MIGKYTPCIIHPTQQGFVQGRSAVANVRKVILPLYRARTHPQEDIAIIGLNAEKAVDNVNLQWLFLILQKVGITGNTLAFLEKTYMSPVSRVCTLGALSAPIPPRKGTKQGCPLSPLLFYLALEPLLRFITESPRFSGLKIGD